MSRQFVPILTLAMFLTISSRMFSDEITSILRVVTSDSAPANEDAAITDRGHQVEANPSAVPAYASAPSSGTEDKTFTGSYTPSRALGVAVFSDDGFKFDLNGNEISDRLTISQALPNITDSYHVLESGNAPLILDAGTSYSLSIKYRNLLYIQDSGTRDIDGITVYLFDPVLQSASISGTVPPQNEYEYHDFVASYVGSSSLGLLGSSSFYRGVILFTGRVSPSFRNYTYSVKRYVRHSIGYIKRSNSSGDITFSVFDENLDDQVGGVDGNANTSSGQIYDVDDPGPKASVLNDIPINSIWAVRIEFEQWFTVNGRQCSESIKWHYNRTLRKTSNGITVMFPNDSQKNSIGTGWLSLDY